MARTSRTYTSELTALRHTLNGAPEDLVDRLASTLADIVRSGVEFDLKELKVNLHNIVVVTEREPEVKAARTAKARENARQWCNDGTIVELANISPAAFKGIHGTISAVDGDRVDFQPDPGLVEWLRARRLIAHDKLTIKVAVGCLREFAPVM